MVATVNLQLAKEFTLQSIFSSEVVVSLVWFVKGHLPEKIYHFKTLKENSLTPASMNSTEAKP